MGKAGVCLMLLLATPLGATELTSPSFVHRGGSALGLAASELVAPGPRFTGGGGSLGSSAAVGFSGAPDDATLAAGFWPLVAGALPSLDVDGDGIPSYADDDDDGDGLSDAFETNTGVFVSPSDTGTSPVLADSDGDGFDDGEEVEAGSDPNDAGSTPGPPVPALGPLPGLVLFALIATLSAPALRPGRRRSQE